MDDLTVFTYCEMPIRTVQKDDQTWLVLADVCKVLDIKNVTQMAQRLDPDERAMFDIGLKNGNANCINEPGLYSVILRSDKPEAKKFKRWVTHEVLPAIRKNGSYGKQEVKLEIAKLIASCKSTTAVKGILSLYGISSLHPTLNRQDSVSAYLKDVEEWEITTVPTTQVYEDYLSFCKDSNFLPVSVCGFSRALHSLAGFEVRRRRINGILTGFYT